MKKIRMISLGAWCRPAYQIGIYAAQTDAAEGLKGPFDWTVTSFRSLENCLHPDLEAHDVLNPDLIESSFAKSAMCQKSGVVFQHAIDPKTVRQFGDFAPGAKIPRFDAFDPVIENAKGRFIHTFQTLDSLKTGDNPILFVRWRRAGHPDAQYPFAFEGETEEATLDAISRFLGHDRFHLLAVQSRIVPGETMPFATPVTDFRTNSRCFSCFIDERKGWNGDQKPGFKGDEHSWAAAFDHTLAQMARQYATPAPRTGLGRSRSSRVADVRSARPSCP